MSVTLMDNPCPRIFIPKNVYTSICLTLNKNYPELATNETMSQENVGCPRTFTLTNKNVSTVFTIISTYVLLVMIDLLHPVWRQD